MSRVEYLVPCAGVVCPLPSASSPTLDDRRVRVDCRVGCADGDRLRRRFDREVVVRVSVAGFLVVDFGVVVEIDRAWPGFDADDDDLWTPLVCRVLLIVDGDWRLLWGLFWFAPKAFLVIRFLPGGCCSSGIRLVRPDLRRPLSLYEVGPSASKRFQGGDMTFVLRALWGPGGGVVASCVRRRLAGRSSSFSSPFVCAPFGPSVESPCTPLWPFVLGTVDGESSSASSGSVTTRPFEPSSSPSKFSRISAAGASS